MHRAYYVAAAGFVALLAAAAIRATFGILMEPLMMEFGWSHSAIATAAALTQLTALWQLYLVWGLLAGAATGAVAPVLAASIAGRWFVARRGLVVGLLTAANSTGQLVFLPLMAHITQTADWRWTMLVVGGAAVVALVCVIAGLRDRPSDVGLAPYGGEAEPPPTGRRPDATTILRKVWRDPVFLALAGSFFICGATTVGLIAVHLIPAAHDHGIPAGRAAGLMAAMGVLDIAGTTGSGWLTDRHPARRLLVVYYTGRGISLLMLPLALSVEGPTLLAFTAFYGLDWIATVPPTVALVTQRFGRIFAAHQLGGAAAAWAAGFMRDTSGTYDGVFVASGLLCFAAALMLAGLRARRVQVATASA
jgi:predicted MFS family arabinose efflux permease